MSAVLWIWVRIRIHIGMDPHHVSNLDPHPDQHLQQIKIRIQIRVKVISWIRNRIRINLQMTSQNVWNMSLCEHYFKGLSLYLDARIWIRIRSRIRVKGRIRIRINVMQIHNTARVDMTQQPSYRIGLE